MTLTTLGFFKAVDYGAIDKSLAELLLEKADNYFFLGGERARVIPGQIVNGSQAVELVGEEEPFLKTCIKVASYFTLILPLLFFTLKIILRGFSDFHIVKQTTTDAHPNPNSSSSTTLSTQINSFSFRDGTFDTSLINKILSFLLLGERVTSVAHVNKVFSKIANDPRLLIREINENKIPINFWGMSNEKSMHFLGMEVAKGVSVGKKILHLDFKRSAIFGNSLPLFINLCPNTTSLAIGYQITNFTDLRNQISLRNVTSLNLARCKVDNYLDQLVNALVSCGNLEHLDLSEPGRVEDNRHGTGMPLTAASDFVRLAQAQPGLKSLNLLGYEADDDICASLSLFQNLDFLSIGGRYATEKGVESLTQLSKLKHFTFRNCEKITEMGCSLIASKLSHLEYLNLTFCTVGDSGFGALTKANPKTMRTLLLRFCGISGAALVEISKLSQLTNIDLSENHIGPDGSAFLVKLVGLRILALFDSDVNKTAISSIILMNRLEVLNLGSNLEKRKNLELRFQNHQHFMRWHGKDPLNAIVDEDCMQLTALTNLRELILNGNDLHKDLIEPVLKKALPRLENLKIITEYADE